MGMIYKFVGLRNYRYKEKNMIKNKELCKKKNKRIEDHERNITKTEGHMCTNLNVEGR